MSAPSEPIVGVVMGSASDWPTMSKADEVLSAFDIAHEVRVVSAHRMPDEMFRDAETAGELHDRLAELGGRSLVEHLDAIVAGAMAATAQDESLATYAPKIEKHDAALDWSLPAEELARRVRAYNPFPGAFCFAGETRIKVWRATAANGSGEPGKVLQSDRDGVIVACGAGLLQLDELQLPGKRRVTAHEFAGQIDLAGQRLG